MKVEDSNFLQRSDERARVLADVEGVRLQQQSPLDVDREIVAEAEDELLARPGQLQPHRAGHQCQDHEEACGGNETLTIGRHSNRVEGGGDQRRMPEAVRIGEQRDKGNDCADRCELGQSAGDCQRENEIELPPPVRREHPVELPEPAPETDLILRCQVRFASLYW